MQNTVVLALAVIALALVIAVFNRRHDARRADESESDDDLVDQAWESFGIGDETDEDRAERDALFDTVDPSSLRRKHSVIALAVMASRAERFELLPALADRARALDGGCGEAAAMAVLSEACTGDPERARALYAANLGAMSGCGSCGTQGPGKILLQEVSIMLDAQRERAMNSEPQAGSLTVRDHQGVLAKKAPEETPGDRVTTEAPRDRHG